MMRESNLYPVISTLQQELESFKKERDSFNVFINDTTKRLFELENQVQLHEEFHKFKEDFNSSLQEWERKHREMFSLYTQVKDLTEKKEKENASFAGSLDTLRSSLCQEVEERQKECTKLEEYFGVTFRDNLNRIEAAKKFAKEEVQKLRDDIHTSPKSVLETNEEILKKVSIALLDGQNAMLKINNMDLSVRVIERKIEQLFSHIKKLELKMDKE